MPSILTLPPTVIPPRRSASLLLKQRLVDSAKAIYTCVWLMFLSFELTYTFLGWPLVSLRLFTRHGIYRTRYLVEIGIFNCVLVICLLVVFHPFSGFLGKLSLLKKVVQYATTILTNLIIVVLANSLFMFYAKKGITYEQFSFLWPILPLFMLFILWLLITSFLFGRLYLRSIAPYSICLLINELNGLSLDTKKAKTTPFWARRAIDRRLYRCQLYLDALFVALDEEKAGVVREIFARFASLERRLRTPRSTQPKWVEDYISWLERRLAVGSFRRFGYQSSHPRSVLDKVNNVVVYRIDSSKVIGTQVELVSHPFLKTLWEQAKIPVKQRKLDTKIIPDRELTKLIRYHDRRAKLFETISAERKLAGIWFLFMWLLIPTTFRFLVGLDGISLFEYGEGISYRFGEFILTNGFLYMSIMSVTSVLQKGFRSRGIDVVLHHRFHVSRKFIYMLIWVMSLFVASSAYAMDFFQIRVASIVDQIINAASIVAIFLVYLYLRPSSRVLAEFADSLLIREFLRLLQNLKESQEVGRRQRVSRNIFFGKKYMKVVARKLRSEFDTREQRQERWVFFSEVFRFLDGMNNRIRLGSEKARQEASTQIVSLIESVLLLDLGEIPQRIPEIGNRLKSIPKSSSPSSFQRIIQFIDIAWLVRLLLAIFLVKVTNLLFPTLWTFIQNLSAWVQILGS